MSTTSPTRVDVDSVMEAAVAAQHEFEPWSEERVDALLKDVADEVGTHAQELAEATIAETGYGNVADKIIKNHVASAMVCRSLAGKPGNGLLRVDAERNIAEIASPMGVVFGLIPKRIQLRAGSSSVDVHRRRRGARLQRVSADALQRRRRTYSHHPHL
ncbi:MAG: aldehyde dehydrogenase family protein [Chloroflexi bacterium]|nr:aldehyde dehydrogenase family protein [Chloroflexota bacterium]